MGQMREGRKQGARCSGAVLFGVVQELFRHYVCCLQIFRAFLQFIVDLLVFLQGFEAVPLDSAEVNKDVIPTIILSDKAKAL